MKNEKQQVCENCTGCALYRIMGKDESKGCIYFVKRPECQNHRKDTIINDSLTVNDGKEVGMSDMGMKIEPYADTFVLADKEIIGQMTGNKYIYSRDVKEFIRLLKTSNKKGGVNINQTGKTVIVPMEVFDKLSGDLENERN